jgi:hypothetical protein
MRVLLVFVAAAMMASTQPLSKSPEFLGVKLGKSLADQFPECKMFVVGTAEYSAWGGTDPDGFRCYNKSLGYIFDHNSTVYEGKDYETEFATALAHTETDADTGQVGYVDTTYPVSSFKETLAALKAKRGAPTTCTSDKVSNLMGAHLTQVHCEWKQPWGLMAITAPSSDDLTMFDVWAVTTHHIQLRKQERLANQKQQSKDF